VTVLDQLIWKEIASWDIAATLDCHFTHTTHHHHYH